MRNDKEYLYLQIKKDEKQLTACLKIIFFGVSIHILTSAISISEKL